MAKWEIVAPGVANAERAAARLRRALLDPGVQFKPAELTERRRCGGGRLGAAGAPLFLISYSNFHLLWGHPCLVSISLGTRKNKIIRHDRYYDPNFTDEETES